MITGWAGSQGVLPGQDPGPITFETIPGGAPVDGMQISTQFLQSHGVTFSLEGGASPVLAQVGDPATAFTGPPSHTSPDMPAAGQNVGQFFLTDDVGGDQPPLPLVVSYTVPVAAASGCVLDIDGLTAGDEAWRIEARNASGEILDQVLLDMDSPNAGDGLATFWSFSRYSAEIHSIRIVFTGNKTTRVGLAFDNFSPASALPNTVDRSIKAVMINGQPVDALDAAGNFFTSVTVQPGENVFEFTTLDALGQTASTTLTLEGITDVGGQP